MKANIAVMLLPLVALVVVGVGLTGCSSMRPGSHGRSADEQRPIRAPEFVQFPTQDGGLIHGHLYGAGNRGVLLAHGGRFRKESWEKQAQQLAMAGFRVLAIDFRGYGESREPGQADIFTAPLHLDVLAGVNIR